ncbi:DNA N-glycosylase [Natronomonas pharaonis DSM 2160]|uniref:DNA-(apurinic or apyrimidinic site) lyase n=1 Tax=Natronomonas pharaonis (strain ATCC 35678 / DSM 2160 / CIP 103997 / JCM 8858 / NBRC 14720 / NCIMB 2260 / Gabara) TaxID=348780 RepID=A0A1U7EXQ9_NATPD|nr:DNA glycosylase [Natronomonas pharaonis]CAI49968.1 DNA N-glycosylase [Natronomonas pharaonis DSM 2160]
MDTGSRPIAAFDGGLDLQTTLESGQSYLWRREDGRMYDDAPAEGAWYYTVLPATATETNEPEVLRVRSVGDRLEWAASTPNAYERLEALLRLDDDLDAIFEATPDDPLVTSAYDAHRGLRLVCDPPFGTLISFICSAQMRVSRIHDMQAALADAYGETVVFDGTEYTAFPTPSALAAASEDALRDLSLGYRAPYVQRTAEMVANGDAHPTDAVGLAYEAARESLTRFVGVGEKVADCVLLFSLGYLEAVPLDTWIRTAIEDHYPDCARGNYADTSRAIRRQFGNEYAGYTQTYVFHHLRTGD